MRSCRPATAFLIFSLLPIRSLLAQDAPSARDHWLLGIGATQVFPGGELVNDGRIGLGTDFQLLRGVGPHKLFAGVDVRFGGIGPRITIISHDGVPLAFDQKDHAQNSFTSISIPVRYVFQKGQIRPYLSGSVGMGIWGIKTWNERAGESASLFPTQSERHIEVTEGVGLIALARETTPSWYVDISLRHSGSGGVGYLKPGGLESVSGKTVINTTPVSVHLFVFSIGVTALFH